MPTKENITQPFTLASLDWVAWGKEPETQELLKHLRSDIAALKDGVIQGVLSLSPSVGVNAGRVCGYEEVYSFIEDSIREQEAE